MIKKHTLSATSLFFDLWAIARKPRPNEQRRAQRTTSDRAHTHTYDRGRSFMPSGENRIEKECTNQFLSKLYWEHWNSLPSKNTILSRLYLGNDPTHRAETCCVCSWHSILAAETDFKPYSRLFFSLDMLLFLRKTLFLATLLAAYLPTSTRSSSEILHTESSRLCLTTVRVSAPWDEVCGPGWFSKIGEFTKSATLRRTFRNCPIFVFNRTSGPS